MQSPLDSIIIVQGGVDMEFKHCPYCGAQLGSDAHFCSACGNQIPHAKRKNGFDVNTFITIALTVLGVGIFLFTLPNVLGSIIGIVVLLIALWIKPRNSILRIVFFIIDILLILLMVISVLGFASLNWY